MVEYKKVAMSASYSSPVSKLLTFGDVRDFSGWPNYLELGLGEEHVDELIEMATDEVLNWGDPESLEVWAPVHAWRALGQLRASAAVEPLFYLFYEDIDWADEELPKVYGMIGRPAIPALERFLADTSQDLWARVGAAYSLEQVAAEDLSTRDECVAILSRQMEQFANNDPTLNGFLIHYLVALKAVEAAPLIERAFAADSIDLSTQGDWEDVQVGLGLKEGRETPRTYSPFQIFGTPRQDVPGQDVPQQASSKAPKKTKARRKQAKASRKKNRKRRK